MQQYKNITGKRNGFAAALQRRQRPSGAMMTDNRPSAIIQQKLVNGINESRSTNAPVQRVAVQGDGVIQMMRPHIKDVNRYFQIYPPGRRIVTIGTYLGPVEGSDSYFRFRTNTYGTIDVHEDDIIGYRPTVGGMHPPKQIRPQEENVEGRDRVFLSEAGLSGVMALQRENPSLLNRMVVTTYEDVPNYPEYQQNRRDLESQGVPILNNFDVSKKEHSNRLNRMRSGGNIHFQMPRVTGGTKGYSTPQLVRDTLMMPKNMKRKDLTVSITTPHPSMYEGKKTRTSESLHNQFYGLENSNSLEGTGMKISKKRKDRDMEEYGYEHRVNTKSESAKVSKKRRKYLFVPEKNEHDDFHSGPRDKDNFDPPPMGGSILRNDLEQVF